MHSVCQQEFLGANKVSLNVPRPVITIRDDQHPVEEMRWHDALIPRNNARWPRSESKTYALVAARPSSLSNAALNALAAREP